MREAQGGDHAEIRIECDASRTPDGTGVIYEAVCQPSGAGGHFAVAGVVVRQRPAARRRQAVLACIGGVMGVTLLLFATNSGKDVGIRRRAVLEGDGPVWNAYTGVDNAWDGFNDPMTDIDAPDGLPKDGRREWDATEFDAFRQNADVPVTKGTGPLSPNNQASWIMGEASGDRPWPGDANYPVPQAPAPASSEGLSTGAGQAEKPQEQAVIAQDTNAEPAIEQAAEAVEASEEKKESEAAEASEAAAALDAATGAESAAEKAAASAGGEDSAKDGAEGSSDAGPKNGAEGSSKGGAENGAAAEDGAAGGEADGAPEGGSAKTGNDCFLLPELCPQYSDFKPYPGKTVPFPTPPPLEEPEPKLLIPEGTVPTKEEMDAAVAIAEANAEPEGQATPAEAAAAAAQAAGAPAPTGPIGKAPPTGPHIMIPTDSDMGAEGMGEVIDIDTSTDAAFHRQARAKPVSLLQLRPAREMLLQEGGVGEEGEQDVDDEMTRTFSEYDRKVGTVNFGFPDGGTLSKVGVPYMTVPDSGNP